MYTKEKVKACSRWLTVLLMLLLCQATLAQEKETPTVTLSKNSYMVTVGEKDFEVPTIIITDKNGNNITSRFSRTYNIEGGTQLTDEQGNVTKPVTWQDATTGTTVQERYGNVTIGSKTGKVTVNINFTPIGIYADKYNSISAQYTIQVNAPENINSTLSLNGNTIADKATLNISTGKDAYNNIKSGSIALPELKLTYTNDNDVYDITQYYDIDYTLDDTKGGVFSLDKTNKTLTSTASNDAETTLTLKATPKADYASVYGDNPYTFTFPVKSSFISTDKKLKTYISFKEHVQEVYKAPGTFNYYIPVITDEHGNDITSLYKSNNTWNVSTQWNSGDLTYTVDFKNIYKGSENPYDKAITFAQGTVDYSSSDNPGQIEFHNDGQARLWAGKDYSHSLSYVRPDDYVITVTATAPSGYENIYEAPVPKKGTTTVTMDSYQGQPDTLHRTYELQSNQYLLNVMKRAPQISFTPDPSKVTLAEGMTMTSGNRFDVKGYFPNVQAPTDSCLYENNDFWYTYFVPEESAWHEGDQLTQGQVKVEVTGSIAGGDTRMETNVSESIKQANGTYTTMTGTRYWSQKAWGTDGNWKIIFHGTGKIPLYYTIRPWTVQKWDISSAQAIIYNIDEQEPVTLVIDPNSFVIHTDETAQAPSVKVYDQFGADLTEHYTFTYNVDNKAIATVDATDHHATGVAQGTATVTVTATEKNDWAQKDYYVDATPGTYTVKVVAADASPAQYEVIYDDVATSSTHTNRMGKLHFIKAGKFAAGQVAYQKVPGINITFGNPIDHHMNVVRSSAKVTEGGDQGLDNDNEDYDETTKTYYKDVLVSNGHPTNKEGVHLMGGETDPIPTNGFFVKIEAVTNGFLTIDARFEADHTVYLVRESDKRTERFYYDSEFIGEQPFHYALMAGQTYYLYADGDQMRLHGLSFEPAFVLMPEDTDPYDAAQAFVNGYTGKLPYLRKTSYPTLEWQPLANEYESDRTISDIATIDDKGYVKAIGPTADKDSQGKTRDNRVIVSAKVYGETKSDGKRVVKTPQYKLRISDIPIYMLTDDEDKPQVIPQSGQRVSTTNILTRMWMTYGGWEHQSEDYPYFKNNDKDAYPDLMYDGWKPAKMDSVGSDNRTIDGFKVASFGEQNPTAENVFSWNQNDKNTFALPVRGAYLKFEPEESGTLIVYLLQNGMTDAQESNTKLGDKYQLRRRAMYILDETGKNVALSKDSEWSEFAELAGKATSSSTDDYANQYGFYTESVFRCSWDKLLKAAGNDENKMFSHSTWKAFSDDQMAADRAAIKSAWENAHIDLGKNNRLLNTTTVQRVIKLSDGSYALPTKGYVRYSLHVKSGKTYYFFMTGSKLGLCGYAFVPEGFTKHYAEWIKDKKPTTTTGETNEADEANRKLLPEPGNKDVYNTESKTTPGYENMTLYDNPTSTQTNPEMTGDNAKVEFVNVTVNRSFQKGKWTGICLPFSVNETQVKQVFGDNAMVISFDGLIPEGEKKGWAHFSQHVNQLIEAGRPYFIKPAWTDDTSKSSVTFNHVSMEGVSPMTLDCVYNPNNLTKDQLKVFQYQFIGNYAPTQVPAYSYVMSANAKDAHGNIYDDGGLVRYAPKNATKTLSMAGFRSYLKPYKDEEGKPITTPAQAKMALIQGFEFDGTATGIDEIVEDMNVDLSRHVQGVYNLNGQLVSEKNSTEGLPAGVYIMNGKKIIVK